MNEQQLIELLNELVKQPNASRIIRDALEDRVIKEDAPESKSRKYASYIPFWA